jgi:hypothetical protein
MLDDNKKTLLQDSNFFAEQGLKIKNQFENPNSSEEVSDNLSEAQERENREKIITEDIKNEWNKEFENLEWNGSGSVDVVNNDDSVLGVNSIASWLKESPLRKEEMDRILNDPNTPESRKEILRKQIEAAKKQNARNSRLEREAKQNAQAAKRQEEIENQKAQRAQKEQERQDRIAKRQEEKQQKTEKIDTLKRARSGDFSGIEIPKDTNSMSDTDKKYWEEISRRKKTKEQKVKRQEKTDTLKRARSGDFSGIEIPENTNGMSDADKKYWEEISRRKKTKEQKAKRQEEIENQKAQRAQKEQERQEEKQQKTEKIDTLKRARSDDFSGIEIPEDTSGMSDADKKYWEEISRRKKTKEQKDERKENQNRKDNTETKPQQQKSFFQSDNEIEVQQDSEERINSFMYSSAVPQTQEIEGSNVINSLKSSLSSSKNDFKNITSDNAQYSKKSAENMDRLQNQIKDLDLKIRTQQNTKTSNPLQNTAAMSYSTNVTKSQQNTNRPIIKSDPITDLNQEYKEIPRFKNDLG